MCIEAISWITTKWISYHVASCAHLIKYLRLYFNTLRTIVKILEQIVKKNVFSWNVLLTISGDGCLDDWKLYNNSCYRISDLTDSFSNIRWSDAKLKCNTLAPNKKAHLLQLETKQEQVWSRCLFSPFFEYLGIVRCIWY